MERILKRKKDFITTQDYEIEELEEILRLSKDVKANPAKYFDTLKGKSICLFFFNPSTRTRNSIEVGIAQLGGYAVYNDPQYSWWGQASESVKDTAIVLSRYHAAIGIRMFPNRVGWKLNESNRQLREFAQYSTKPVINLEDDRYHPCQAITDAFTIREKFPEKKRCKVVISWVYHPKPLPQSVTNSITLITTRFGHDVTLACPPGYELADDIMETAATNAKNSGGSFKVEHDWKTAYQDADVLYIKSWGSLKYYGDAKEEKKLRVPYRNEWCVTPKHLDYTDKNSILMHCLPIRRNIEATDEALDGPHSVIYDQAENRLHTQKALMYYLLRNPFSNEPTFY